MRHRGTQKLTMIYVIADFSSDLTRFIFEGLHRTDVRLVQYSSKTKGLAQKIRRWLESFFPVVPLNLYGSADLMQLSKDITPQDVVILFSVMNAKDLRLLHKYVGRGRIFSFLWNPVVEFRGKKFRIAQRLRAIRKVSDHVTTFDAQDAQTYGFTLLPQPFRHVALPATASAAMDYDFCFIGMDKGRLPFLMRFKTLAEQNGYRCFFRIVPDRGAVYSAEERTFLSHASLTYAENLEYVARSRCLLEIVQHNQFGSTMRGVEALFFHRKIITTSPLARQEPGFDARRVLVLDGTDPAGAHIDMARIASFMDTPLGPPDDQALQAHEINHWLQHFQSP